MLQIVLLLFSFLANSKILLFFLLSLFLMGVLAHGKSALLFFAALVEPWVWGAQMTYSVFPENFQIFRKIVLLRKIF